MIPKCKGLGVMLDVICLCNAAKEGHTEVGDRYLPMPAVPRALNPSTAERGRLQERFVPRKKRQKAKNLQCDVHMYAHVHRKEPTTQTIIWKAVFKSLNLINVTPLLLVPPTMQNLCGGGRADLFLESGSPAAALIGRYIKQHMWFEWLPALSSAFAALPANGSRLSVNKVASKAEERARKRRDPRRGGRTFSGRHGVPSTWSAVL
ncbi:hypothetical protein V8C26DRAFT_97801 [Trichoderma gracile]